MAKKTADDVVEITADDVGQVEDIFGADPEITPEPAPVIERPEKALYYEKLFKGGA